MSLIKKSLIKKNVYGKYKGRLLGSRSHCRAAYWAEAIISCAAVTHAAAAALIIPVIDATLALWGGCPKMSCRTTFMQIYASILYKFMTKSDHKFMGNS